MKRIVRSMAPSPALVVAGLALFVSLGGVSYRVGPTAPGCWVEGRPTSSTRAGR